MTYNRSLAMDSGCGKMVRVLLLKYRKAFDLIDHHVLLNKLEQAGLPVFMVSWITTFLYLRRQRIRIGDHVTDSRYTQVFHRALGWGRLVSRHD